MNRKPFNLVNSITIIGLPIALLALYLTINPVSSSTKNLGINLRSQSPIITDEFSNGLEFTVNGVATNNVYLNEIEIFNSGNVTIEKQDFFESQPIQLFFGEDCTILKSSIKAEPETFNKRVKYIVDDTKYLNILPTLINAGDSAIVKIITAKCKPKFEVNADISGIPKISQNWSTTEQINSWWKVAILLVVMSSGMYFSIIYLPNILKAPWYISTFSFAITMLVSVYIIQFLLVPKIRLVDQIPAMCREIYRNIGGGDF
jgi:hypothetical protein